MDKMALKYVVLCVMVLWVCALVACSPASSSKDRATTPTAKGTSSINDTTPVIPTSVPGTPVIPTSVPGTPVIPTSVPGTPGVGPIVILSPTPVPGGGTHSQQVVFADRTLIINDVSKGAGADANLVAVSLKIMLKNTSGKVIMNESSYFSLLGSEGDAFGLPATTTSSFFGSIASNSSRSGTIVFQVPAGAIKGLHLLYRSNVATETVFLPITA